MDLRWLSPGDEDELVRASPLFDHAVRPDWARAFLARQGHHLCLASVDGVAAGFVSGVEMIHPDKGTEMFLYELGVDEAHRGRGVGSALVTALAQRARDLGCYDMWVLTDDENVAARRTYVSGGASADGQACVLLEWRLSF